MWSIKHTKTGELLNIKHPKTTVGRLGTTLILKNDDSISRKHCTLLLHENELNVIDDGAKYGTFVNSDTNKVTKKGITLKAGDKIHFGVFENVWEVHYEGAQAKRKHMEVEATSDENSSSSSNVLKKKKTNEAQKADKYDIVIESSDEGEMPLIKQKPTRQRNVINYSEDVEVSSKPLTTAKDSQKIIDKSKQQAVRSQLLFENDSDDDNFIPTSQNANKLKKLDNFRATSSSKLILDDSDAFNIDPPKRNQNSRKRPSVDIEDHSFNAKVPKTTRNTRGQTTLNDSNVSVPSTSKASTSSVIEKASSTQQQPSVGEKQASNKDVFDFGDSIRPRTKRQAAKDNFHQNFPSTSNTSISSVSEKASSTQQQPSVGEKQASNKDVFDFGDSIRPRNKRQAAIDSFVASRASMSKETIDETDKSRTGHEEPPVLIKRKRLTNSSVFDFGDLGRQRPRRQKQKDDDEDQNEVVELKINSPKKTKSLTFRTTNLCNKELYASFDYGIPDDDSGEWMSTLSNIKIKTESCDETDNSSYQSCSISRSNINKSVDNGRILNLDVTIDTSKVFKKQQFEETSEAVRFKSMSVKDWNEFYRDVDD